jgi:hypothetical protein
MGKSIAESLQFRVNGDDSSTPPGDAQDHPIQRRLQRMEEGLGFNEHTLEQMHALVLDLGRRIDTLTRRLATLEAAQHAQGQTGGDGPADADGANTDDPGPNMPIND